MLKHFIVQMTQHSMCRNATYAHMQWNIPRHICIARKPAKNQLKRLALDSERQRQKQRQRQRQRQTGRASTRADIISLSSALSLLLYILPQLFPLSFSLSIFQCPTLSPLPLTLTLFVSLPSFLHPPLAAPTSRILAGRCRRGGAGSESEPKMGE